MGRRRTFGNVRKLPSGRCQARYLVPYGCRDRGPRALASIADANDWLMHRIGHSSAAAAVRYQHATRDRDAVIARARNDVIEGAVIACLAS